MSIDDNFIRDRITQLRMQKDISEHQMSLQLGRSPSYIRTITSENGLPSIPAFFDICDFFEISALDFFDCDLAEPARIRNLLEQIKQLNDDELSALETLVALLLKNKT